MADTVRIGAWSMLLLILAVRLPLGAALLTAPRNRRANRLLAAATIAIAGLLTPFILGYAGAYDAWPWLSFAPFAVPLALGPLLYGYMAALAEDRMIPRRHWLAPAVQVGLQGGVDCGNVLLARLIRGINGGSYFFVRLPETGFEVDLPLIGYFPRTPQPDAGIVPDVIVPLRRAAIIASRDDALLAARKLLLR